MSFLRKSISPASDRVNSELTRSLAGETQDLVAAASLAACGSFAWIVPITGLTRAKESVLQGGLMTQELAKLKRKKSWEAMAHLEGEAIGIALHTEVKGIGPRLLLCVSFSSRLRKATSLSCDAQDGAGPDAEWCRR